MTYKKKRGTTFSDMDAGLWHFLGSQRVELKARAFFLLALPARRPGAIGFFKNRVLHTAQLFWVFFGHNSSVSAPILLIFSAKEEPNHYPIIFMQKNKILDNYE